jgi:hypothetical protein
MKKLLVSILASLFFVSYANAGPSLSGLYFELGSAAVGVEMDGNFNDDDSDVSYGTVGKTAVTGSYGLGFMTSRERPLSLDIGYAVTPGEAKISATSDDSSTDVTLEVSDATEWYVTAQANLTEDASVYIKYGDNDADIKVTGDINNPGNLNGTTVALGTVMSWGSSMYIRTEAGITDYDKISATGKGTSGGIGTDVKVTATPTLHYGKIAIGFKF